MAKIDHIKFEPGGIGSLIMNKFLKVPPYQRSYAWEEKQVDELFLDISASVKVGEYFIGSVVISEDEGENHFEIIDGQQRIATIIILLSAIRNYYETNNEIELCEDIEKKFLRSYDRNERDFIPKLKLNDIDNDYFQNLIIKKGKEQDKKIKPIRESHLRLSKAFEIAKDFVNNLTKPTGNTILVEWTNFIENELKVINVKVPDLADAYTIFETLNDRGKALATTDLIKNYLFKVSKNRISETREFWTRMIAIIEAAQSEEEVETFIKYFWSSRYGFTRIKDRNLFKKIKEQITKPPEVVDLTKDLQINSERYIALLNHANKFWDVFSNSCKDYIRILNTLKLTQYIPLMLAILEKFEKEQVKKSLKFLVDWFVRNLVTGNLGSGTIEELYSSIAVNVISDKIKNASQLKKALIDYAPKDSEFKDQFKIARVSQAYLARYYLRALENQENGEGEPELVPNENAEVVNLEHIMPRNPDDLKKDWKNFDEETHQSYVRRIGNLALLKNKLNSDIGNGPYKDKVKALSSSKFKLTSLFGKQNKDWTPKSIEDRQSYLADLALKTWNMKI